LDTNIDETNSNVNDLDIDSSLNSRTGSKIEENCGLRIDCNIIGLTEKPEYFWRYIKAVRIKNTTITIALI
jgi:hypothetical protein